MVRNLPASVSFHHSSSFSQQLKSVSIAASLNAIAAAAAASSQIQKLRGKRKSATDNNTRTPDLNDKMLNDCPDSADNKKLCHLNRTIANESTLNEKGNQFLWLTFYLNVNCFLFH